MPKATGPNIKNIDLRPSDFMRARRPHLFSDSYMEQESKIDQTQFEYLLETLTSRGQETEFERFCRRLAEKEICPNLLPQTGPTGGGDSKVDSETYPVAPEVAETWFVGELAAASERWAFAFSAKKDWRPKVRSDVKKIADTKRDYKKAFFISNQFISDKKRAEMEDELSNEYSMDVRILDRAWIVDKVFGNKRWDVVRQTLSVPESSIEPKIHVGPNDHGRKQDLEELDQLLSNPERYVGTPWLQYEDMRQSALIARGLGLPKTDVDGRFLRAQRFAEAHCGDWYRFRTYYDRAWTGFWWFDNFAELEEMYDRAAEIALKSKFVWEAEKLCNLWTAGLSWIARNCVADQEAWNQRTTALREFLLAVASNPNAPTSALVARWSLTSMDLLQAMYAKESLDDHICNLRGVLVESQGHLAFPMSSTVEIVEGLAEIGLDSPEFDRLFHAATAISAGLLGKGKTGGMHLKLGENRLKCAEFSSAIREFSAAQACFIQDTHKHNFVSAAAGLGLAYEGAGLLWASRTQFAVIADTLLYEQVKDGELRPDVLPPLKKLVWLELQLGRPSAALSWLSYFLPLWDKFTSASDEEDQKKFWDEHNEIDVILGMVVLRTELDDLKVIGALHKVLGTLSLTISDLALCFALGHVGMLAKDLGEEEAANFSDMAKSWSQQPAASDISFPVQWYLGTSVSMRTVLFGCEVKLVVENSRAAVLLAESLLSYWESFFSTGLDVAKIPFAAIPNFEVQVRIGDVPQGSPFSIEEVEDDCGVPSLLVIVDQAFPEGQNVPNEDNYRAFAMSLGYVFGLLQVPGGEKWFEHMFSTERAQDRAAMAVTIGTRIPNILEPELGYYPPPAWKNASDDVSLDCKRDVEWFDGVSLEPLVIEHTKANNEELSQAFGVDGLRHDEVRLVSPINSRVWNRAGWCATGVAVTPMGPPLLLLGFGNIEEGRKIFRGWRKQIGTKDTNDYVGLTIITGIDRNNPASYRVAVMPGNDYLNSLSTTRHAVMHRLNTMSPRSTENLDTFRTALERWNGTFLVAPVEIKSGQMVQSQIGFDLAIEKNQVHILPAWELTVGSYAAMVLHPEDDPFIPEGVENAPVLEVLEARRKS